ncbi:hypothetical protein L0244_28425, partial [bacterium]|nr:hypothetical protein [bacterium]
SSLDRRSNQRSIIIHHGVTESASDIVMTIVILLRNGNKRLHLWLLHFFFPSFLHIQDYAPISEL